MYGKDKVPAGGIISGIGVVNGVKCVSSLPMILPSRAVRTSPSPYASTLRAQEVKSKTIALSLLG